MKKNKLLLSIALLLGSMSASAQWNSEAGQALTPKDMLLHFDVQRSGEGITYLGFSKLVNEDPEKLGNRYSDGNDIVYYLQILDREGNKLFPNPGKLVSHEPTRSFTMGDDDAIYPDSDGNLIYIVKDERNCNTANCDEQSYFVYKLSPTGDFLWETPVDLNKGFAYPLVANIKVIEVDGSYIFAHDIQPTSGNRLYMEIDRVSKDGKFLWDEPLLLTDDVNTFAFPFLNKTGSGDFLLVYSFNTQLYAQRYTSGKEPVWESPTLIYSGGFTQGNSPFTAVTVISDHSGGCFVGWFDDRNRTDYEKAYAVHVLENGDLGFVTSGNGQGLQLSWNSDRKAYRPTLFYDPSEEILYTVFEERDADQYYRSLVMQKVSKEGELLWNELETESGGTANGLVFESSNGEMYTDYTIQAVGKGKIIVFYQHTNASYNTGNIAVLLNVSGDAPEYVWEEKKLIFEGDATGEKSDLIALPLTDQSWFPVFWDDFRNTANDEGPAIYARQFVNEDIVVPDIPEPSGVNASLATTGLNVTLSGHTLSILNAKGARIDRVRLYAADGSLRQDFPVQSSGNVLIPISATPKIAIVEVTAGGAKAVFKVVTSDE